jgi:methylmalonyl-CoA mutase N-terminal domain/subunit
MATAADSPSADLTERTRLWEGLPAVAAAPPAATDSGLPVKVAYTPLDAPFPAAHVEELGLPGEYPYARGIHPTMYRGRLWTMRLYSGWGTAEDTNERFRYLLDRGQTGLSVALDLPTQMGYDSDHPLATPEIGKVGVSVDSLADMERIFEGIPLNRISTSFTINATAPILLAMYQVVGERQGVAPGALRGTVQNDILKEYLARKTYVYPPRPSLRLVADVIEYSIRELPKFNPISVCGYHMRQAGCDAIEETAMALANASAYVQALVDRGLDVDTFAPRFSFNLSTMRDFFEEIAKHRAARRIWARTMRERFGARDPRSWTLRLFSGGDGTSLTAVEPHNNIVRIAMQALAIVLSGAQAVHTISWDEAIGIPTEASSLLALRTQQILAHESGVARCADPLGGSFYVESLTSELEQRITAMMQRIEERGGAVGGVEDGTLEQAIADSAYEQQLRIESGEHVIVGVNRFVQDEATSETPETFVVGPEVIDRQLARLARVRADRDAGAVEGSLRRLEAVAATEENAMPAILDAVRAYATVGEITAAMGRVFGYHRRSTVT